jgi:hypothetical protein
VCTALWPQDACKTCDADHSLVCRTLHEAGLNPNTTQVLVLHPETLYDVLRSIRAVGAAAGVADRAKQLVDQLQARLHAVGLAVQARSPAIAAETVARATVHIFEGRSAEFAARAQQLPLPPVPPCKPGLARLSGGAVGNTQGPGAVTQPPQDQQQHQRQQQQQDRQEPQTQQQQQQGLQRVPQGLSPWQRAPRVLSLEGLNPLVLGGQWLPDVKLAAGAVDAARQSPGDAPHRITWEMVSCLLSDAPAGSYGLSQLASQAWCTAQKNRRCKMGCACTCTSLQLMHGCCPCLTSTTVSQPAAPKSLLSLSV